MACMTMTECLPHHQEYESLPIRKRLKGPLGQPMLLMDGMLVLLKNTIAATVYTSP